MIQAEVARCRFNGGGRAQSLRGTVGKPTFAVTELTISFFPPPRS